MGGDEEFRRRLSGAHASAALLQQMVLVHVRELAQLAELKGVNPLAGAHTTRHSTVSDQVCERLALGDALVAGRMCLERSAPSEERIVSQDSGDQAGLFDSYEVEMHHVWCGDVDSRSEQLINLPKAKAHKMRSRTSNWTVDHLGDLVGGAGVSRWCVWLPSSTGRISWELLSLVFICWDLLILPLSVFGADSLDVVRVLGIVTTFFWLLDMVYSFFVGFLRPDGLVEMRLPQIARHYFRSWFLFDVVVVGVDLGMLIDNGDAESPVDAIRLSKSIRAARLVRAFRMVRFARVAKLKHLLEDVGDVVFSNVLLTMFNIFKLLLGVALVTHFIACGWYAVGNSGTDGWVSVMANESGPHLYITSFHWSMAQFTPAPNNIHPTNFQERLYALLTLYLGLMLFTSLIGRVTALLAQGHQVAFEEMTEAFHLRELLTRKKVSIALGNRIKHFLSNSRGVDLLVMEEDVISLKKVPASMLMELHREMYSPELSRIPVFTMTERSQNHLWVEICHTAVEERRVKKGDELFANRSVGASLYIVLHGGFKYYNSAVLDGVLLDETHIHKLHPGDWLAEAVLWTLWEHRGLLSATVPGSAMVVHGERFRLAVQRFRVSLQMLRVYARHFVHRLCSELDSGQVDDMWRPFEDGAQLEGVMSGPIPELPQQVTSMPASGPVLTARTILRRSRLGGASRSGSGLAPTPTQSHTVDMGAECFRFCQEQV